MHQGHATGHAADDRTGATVNTLMRTLVAELEAEGVPAPLHQPLTLGLVWLDLCRLAAEEPPAAVQVLLDAPVVASRRPAIE